MKSILTTLFYLPFIQCFLLLIVFPAPLPQNQSNILQLYAKHLVTLVRDYIKSGIKIQNFNHLQHKRSCGRG